MKAISPIKGFSEVEVTNITKHGIWLLTKDHEIFVAFKEFPQFQDASVSKLMKVEQPTPSYLRWPDLDIDLAVESFRCFPLVSNTPRPTSVSNEQAMREPPTQSKKTPRSDPIKRR
jgi:hypothetical protein